jgi:polar amino acid transport system substrate-binding protein
MKKILFMVALMLSVCSFAFASAKTTGKNGKQVIRIGTNATHPPFTYVDEKTRQFDGHDIKLLQKVLTNLGYEYVVDDMKFDGLIPSIESNKIDVIACALSVNEERAKKVLFTDTYYEGGTKIAVLRKNNSIKGFDDLKGKKVGVELGTIQAKIAHDNASKIGEIVEYNSEEIFLALKTGKVDATISDMAIATYLISHSKVVDAKFVGDAIGERGMAFAVNKKNAKLANEINAELARLKKNGWYKQNYDEWFSLGK